MCGITGVVTHRRLDPSDHDMVRRMTKAMRRRGPDDEGFWTDDAHASFGFRRLAVIDPSPAGHQPMTTEDGNHALVYNGELYNYRELRAELARDGIPFRTNSDTEVVLRSLVHWGPDALKRFNGMFALALYDARARTLLLARDPLGIKPLYYLDGPEGLAFGSQYDQVVGHPWCNRTRLRMDVLGLYLRLTYIPPPYALVEGTAQVPPGHTLLLHLGGRGRPTVQPFKVLEPQRQEQDDVAAAIERAVQRQLVSDVPIGAFLSGGIDSPLVAAAAAKHTAAKHTDRLPAFTIGSTDAAFDESPDARAFAEAVGVDHHVRIFDESMALNAVKELPAAYSEPFADFSALPTMLVSSVAAEHVKVALSGDGGDELFFGYPRFAKVLRSRPYFRLPRPARIAAYAATKKTPSVRPARGVMFPTIGDWYLDGHSTLRTTELQRLAPAAAAPPPDFDLYRLDDVPSAEATADWMRWNELRGHLQMVLLKVDRASMFHGLEVRPPLLDIELAELALSLGPDDCIEDGVGKQPLRDALADHVPPALIQREKRGFSMPMGSWLRHEMRTMVEDRLLGNATFPADVFDRGEVRRVVTAHFQGHDYTRAVWTLLALQLWADTHWRPLDA